MQLFECDALHGGYMVRQERICTIKHYISELLLHPLLFIVYLTKISPLLVDPDAPIEMHYMYLKAISTCI